MEKAFEAIDLVIQKGIDNGAFPGACVCVGINGHEYYKKSFGSATEQTLFDIASLTKIVGATMVAFKLIENGRLCLSDKISDFFDTPPDKQSITVQHLLTHTSGISDHFYLSDYTAAPSDAAKIILSQPLKYETGTAVLYSCMGYILLGKLLEKLEGKPINKLVAEYVFSPLNMKNTTYSPTGDIAPTELDAATKKPLCGIVHDENARFLNGISANAGIFSNITDMGEFAKMLSRGGKKQGGEAYISCAMLQKASMNYTEHLQGENRGLGFNLSGNENSFMGDLVSPAAYGHTGFTGTSLVIDPQSGLYVVLLTNRVCPTRENTQIFRIRRLLHNASAAAQGRALAQLKALNANIITLAHKLNINEKAIDELKIILPLVPWIELAPHINKLCIPSEAQATLEEVKKILEPIERNGFGLLGVYFAAVLNTRKIYAERNISDDIFIETMKCFKRFIDETLKNTGEICFDRGFWPWRHTACLLFRLGCLEFEYFCLEKDIVLDNTEYKKGEYVLSVHIPSDAVMTREALDASYNMAKSFFADSHNYSGFVTPPRAIYCHTWLLSPGLIGLLNESSAIYRFASDYTICEYDTKSTAHMLWLFGKSDDTALTDLPENTSLQKKAKTHLLSGGALGVAAGIIKL